MAPVRKATPADAGRVAALNQSVQDWHASHYPERFYPGPDQAGFADHFATELADPEVTCFLSGEPAMGYALCRFVDRPASVFSPALSRVYIAAIGVDPLARRQGHGAALIAAARQFARDMGCAEVTLDTWSLNKGAHRFFETQGFAIQRMIYATRP